MFEGVLQRQLADGRDVQSAGGAKLFRGSVAGARLGLCAERRDVVVELADRITVDSEQCGGRPCVRGMRIRVGDVLDLLANGLTPEEIVEEMPDLELEDVRASLRFASRRLDHPVVAA